MNSYNEKREPEEVTQDSAPAVCPNCNNWLDAMADQESRFDRKIDWLTRRVSRIENSGRRSMFSSGDDYVEEMISWAILAGVAVIGVRLLLAALTAGVKE